MARELLLFRHGKAVKKGGTDDYQRPITDKGKRGAQRVGVWLWQKALRPDHIVCSPAERARTSAQKLCKAMGRDAKSIVTDRRLYQADIRALLDVLADCPAKKKRVLLVGHNPGLEELLLLLLGGKAPLPDEGRLLPTATLARLRMPDSWNKLGVGSAQLKALTRPDDLPKKFPFPAPNGKQKRDRPAYYYRQSAVVPYRKKNGELQILLIGSSKRNHLVVPKGIHEPGLSAQESAAEEAFEEAGIRGEIGSRTLGQYDYDKWGATCTVAVYAMRVTEMLPESEWEETHRGRQWLSVEEAADSIRQPEMRPMIRSLPDLLATDR